MNKPSQLNYEKGSIIPSTISFFLFLSLTFIVYKLAQSSNEGAGFGFLPIVFLLGTLTFISALFAVTSLFEKTKDGVSSNQPKVYKKKSFIILVTINIVLVCIILANLYMYMN